jgi:hypothetical protein
MMTGRVLIAVGTATMVGMLALPVWRVGIGWPLAAFAVAGTALVARRLSKQDGGGSSVGGWHDRAWRIAAGVAALLLAAVPAIRAAEWLAALCLMTAALLGSYALAGGRSWGGVLAGAVAIGPAAVRGLGWSVGTARAERHWLGRATAGLLVGTTLVVIFGLLFRSADPAFRDLLNGWLHEVEPETVARAGLGGVMAALGALAAAQLAGTRSRTTSAAAPTPRLGPVEWAIPLAMLDILFGIFVWLQLRVLFGGEEYVLGPGGPDYAVHARSGFTQLAVVTALTLVVIATLVLVARRGTALERGLVRLLGGLLCALTLVIVASACDRLALYAATYGLTIPRLLAFAFEVWLGLVIVLLLVAGVRLRAPWMPRATLAVGVVVLFTLVAINPDAVMARTLLARLDGPYPVDYRYLSGLSTDAAPEIGKVADHACRLEYGPDRGAVVLGGLLVVPSPEDEPWYAANLSRYRAYVQAGIVDEVCQYGG